MWKWLNPLNDPWLKLLALLITAFVFLNLSDRTYKKTAEMQELEFPNVRIVWLTENSHSYRVDKTSLPEKCMVKFKSEKLTQEKTEIEIRYTISAEELDAVTDDKLQIEFQPEDVMIKEDNTWRTWKRASDSDLHVSELTTFPSSIPVHVEKWIEDKIVKIEPVYNPDELPEGYILDEVSTENKTDMHIAGPKYILDTIESIKTKNISLKDKTENFRIAVELEDAKNKGIEYPLSSSVNVFVRISKQKIFMEKYTYKLSVLETVSQNGKLKLADTVQLPDIVLSVSSEKSDLSKEWFHPYIDLSTFTNPGVYSVPVKYWCEQHNAKVLECSEKMVSVTLEAID